MTTLSDVLLNFVDCVNRTAPESESGSFFAVGTPAMRGNTIDYSQARRIDRQTFDRWTRRLVPEEGDILLAREAPVGPVVRVPAGGHVAAGQRTLHLRANPARIDPQYLYYYLIWGRTQSRIMSLSMGSTVPHLRVADARTFDLDGLRPRTEQRAIAEVLGALDDKIAANRRTIDTADSLRAAIWDKATRDAHHVPLSSLAAFINGGAFTKGASGNGRPVIRIVEMNQGVSDATVRTDLEVKDDQVVRAGDFLMSWSGSLTTSRWFGEESILNQHIFKVIPAEGVPLWAVASAVETKMPYFQFVASNKATTMGHIQRHHLDEDVAWPTVTSALNLQGTALWDLALAAERENQVLASTRDELLPLLMSGRITVGAASSHVEEVV